MSIDIDIEDFPAIAAPWREITGFMVAGSPFLLPDWVQTCWDAWRPAANPFLCAGREEGRLVGVAPLMVSGSRAVFIGSAETCDYLDMTVLPGREKEFCRALLDHLVREGIGEICLEPVRPDSLVITSLREAVLGRGLEMACRQTDVSLEVDLGASWEDYLTALSAKQRHEVRRKLRRIEEAADISYRVVDDLADIRQNVDTFLRLFRESRSDKANFMTEPMEAFFRSVIAVMSEAGLLRLGLLEIGGAVAAMVLCFDYQGTVYLYNSGYDPQYRSLSAGLISKALCIRDSIQKGRRRFDFLKGAEEYKYRLGGVEIPLHECRIDLRK